MVSGTKRVHYLSRYRDGVEQVLVVLSWPRGCSVSDSVTPLLLLLLWVIWQSGES